MQVATIVRMSAVRWPPSSSQVKSQFRCPRTSRLSSSFSSIVGGLDVAVVHEEQQPIPLAIQVAQALAQWRLGRGHGALLVDPRAKHVEDGATLRLASIAPLVGVVAGERRLPLDGEQLRYDTHTLECDAVPGTRSLHKTASSVSPAWDRGGFVAYYKRLARGRFQRPPMTAGTDRVVLDGTQLAMLLRGFDPVRTRRTDAWQPTARRADA